MKINGKKAAISELNHLQRYKVKDFLGKWITGRWFNKDNFCQFECDNGGFLRAWDLTDIKDVCAIKTMNLIK